ncbi:centromere associated Kip4p [Cryptosporidium sp. chipmunk genotype I]|uniref:centromere associated Kip4p n=1 Tax=Cryptosporidium sp. chipmunk genotype I TaxID=1280935 RepID=UPI00351A815E|nr:centromere associated Kip4p [Cryptosporidium sp. chipmunk genotype I]
MNLSRPGSSKVRTNEYLNFNGKSKLNRTKITVVVRKRPLTDNEIARNDIDVVEAVCDENTIYVHELKTKVDCTKYIDKHSYTFDRVYSEQINNRELYEDIIRPLTENIFTPGFKCSCFAYGQTGSGKTYTMMGSENTANSNSLRKRTERELGIFELAVNNIFELLEQSEHENKEVYVSFFEIYCDKLYDLLNNQKLVSAMENSKREVVVKDLTERLIKTKEDLLSVISKGLEYRRTAQNSMNDMSSRSHAILQIEIRSRIFSSTKESSLQSPLSPKFITYGKMVFIDLAGSERGADTVHSTRQTQQDGAGINRSLLALKECIRALHDQQSSHVPFRQSELTKVLKDVFVGNAHSVMIANIGPCYSCSEQTLNTLRYAHRVKELRKKSISRSDTFHSDKYISKNPPTRKTTAPANMSKKDVSSSNESPRSCTEEEFEESNADTEFREDDFETFPEITKYGNTAEHYVSLLSPNIPANEEHVSIGTASPQIEQLFGRGSIFNIPGIGVVNTDTIPEADLNKLKKYLGEYYIKKQEELASSHATHLGILCECLKEESLILKDLLKKNYSRESSNEYIQELKSLITRKSESLEGLKKELAEIEELVSVMDIIGIR